MLFQEQWFYCGVASIKYVLNENMIMVLKTDKKNEPPFPFRQLTVVNSTHILDEDLGRTLLLAWSGILHPSENPLSRLHPGEEDTKS